VDDAVVTKVIENIEKKFGKMAVKRGLSHTFVGMDFTLTGDGKVNIFMKDYIEECMDSFEEFGEKIKGRGNTPAANTLFEVKEESKELDDEKSEVFHHIVSKLLYVSKWD